MLALIRQFLSSKSHASQKELRDRIFNLFYKDFDRWIKIVFHQQGIPYESDEIYYNTVFLEIYEKVFSLESFRKVLSSYDPKKAKFERFFSIVVQNKVRDCINKERDHLEISLQQLEGDKLEIFHNRKNGSLQDDSDCSPDLNDLLKDVPVHYRVVIKLRFIAYLDFTDKEFEYIVGVSRCCAVELKEKIVNLKNSLRNSKNFKKGICAGNLIPALKHRLCRQEGKIIYLKNILESFGMSEKEIENLEERAENHTLMELKELLDNARKRYLQSRGDGLEIHKLTYQQTHKQLFNVKKRLENQRSLALKLEPLSSKDIAGILGIDNKTVDTRFYKGKKKLEEIYCGKKN